MRSKLMARKAGWLARFAIALAGVAIAAVAPTYLPLWICTFVLGIVVTLGLQRLRRNRLVRSVIGGKRDSPEHASLRASEARYRSLIERSNDMIFRMSVPEGNYEYVSPAAERVIGYKPEQLLAEPLLIQRAIHPDFRDFFEREWSKIVQGIVEPIFEYCALDAAGNELWISQSNVGIYDERGRIIAIEGICRNDTARRKILQDASKRELELNSAKERYRTLFEQSPDAVMVIDPTSLRAVEFNDLAPEMLGYAPEEFRQLRIPDYEAVESPAEVAAHAAQLLLDGRGKFETKMRRKDGQFLDILANIRVIEVDGQKYFHNVFRDITPQKQAEEALRVRDKAIASALAGLALADSRGRVTYVNDSILKMWGLDSADEILGRHAVRFWQTPRSALSSISSLLANDRWIGELTAKRKDGTFFETMVAASLIRDDRGNPSHIMASFIDVTDQKEAERALRHSQQQLAEAQRIASIGSWDLDVCKNSLHWSDEVYRIFELDKESFEATYEGFLRIVHPDDRELVDSRYQQSLKTRQPYRLVHRIRTPNNAIKYVEERCETFFDERGNPIRSMGTVQDVTRLKLAEAEILNMNVTLEQRVLERTAELEAAKIAAEEANRAKSEFLSRMSHELRTPLNAILGYAQLLETKPQIPMDLRPMLEAIIASGWHLLELINDLLDFAKLEQGKLGVHLEDVDPREILETCILAVQPLAAERRISVRNEISSSEVAVRADPLRLRQVFLNLLTNAIKYNRVGGTVTITCEQSGDSKLRFNITDSGLGIRAEDLTLLFQPFSRLYFSNQTIEGSGIGLALSKNLMELMHGRIAVHSVYGQGSTFSIEIPCVGPCQGCDGLLTCTDRLAHKACIETPEQSGNTLIPDSQIQPFGSDP